MRIEYKKSVFRISANDRTGEDFLDHIPKGDRVKVFVQAFKADSTDEPTNIMLGLDENGNEILTPLPSSMFDGKSGTIDDRMLLINYKGGGTVQIKASSIDLQPVKVDTIVTVVFRIETDEAC